MFKKFFKAIFVISGVLASVWKAFIKFHWHGQITTLSCSLMSPTCFSMSFLCSTLASFMEFALATCFSIQANIASQLSHHSWSVELMFPMSSWKKNTLTIKWGIQHWLQKTHSENFGHKLGPKSLKHGWHRLLFALKYINGQAWIRTGGWVNRTFYLLK